MVTMELNTIYNEDCLITMAKMPDKSVDMIFTDPPYGINYKSSHINNHDYLQNDKLNDWIVQLPLWLTEFKRILKDDAVCCCCCCGGGKTPVSSLFTIEFIKHFNLIQTIIWDKKTIGLGWKYRPSYETIVIGSKSKDNYKWHTDKKNISNIVRFNNWIPKHDEHPTQKPYDLIRFFLQLHSQKNEIVYDAFMGGGSTAIACIKENRNFLGSEISKKYCDLANKRIQNFVNQTKMEF